MVSLQAFKRVIALSRIQPVSSVGVAVSGGSDSVALTYLAKQVFERVVGITVDHRVSAESEDEVIRTKDIVQTIGAEHELVTLDWPNGPPTKGKVEKMCHARRSKALLDVCLKHDLKYLLMGDHWDDQTEAMVYRIARCSGVNGLACMQELSSAANPAVTIFRPLLSFKKESLRDFCQEQKLEWIEKPTNSHPVFYRNIVENLKKDHPDIIQGLAEIRETCAAARSRTLKQTFQALQKGVRVDREYGYAIVQSRIFAQLPHHVAINFITLLAKYISGVYTYLRTTKVDYACRTYFRNGILFTNRPLGSCTLFLIDDTKFGIARTGGSIAQHNPLHWQSIKLGETVHWNNRFILTLNPLPTKGIPHPNYGEDNTFYVRPMHKKDWNLLSSGVRKVRAYRLPPEMSRGGLPVIVTEGNHVVAIPHFRVIDKSYGVTCSYRFQPLKGLEELADY